METIAKCEQQAAYISSHKMLRNKSVFIFCKITPLLPIDYFDGKKNARIELVEKFAFIGHWCNSWRCTALDSSEMQQQK